MSAFQDLQELMDIILKWENDLKDFYDVAEVALKNKRSKNTIIVLRENHVKNMQIIKGIRLDDFGKNEWVRNIRGYKTTELIPIGKITRESSPTEIFEYILDYEKKLKDFYSLVSKNLLSTGLQELFVSLTHFKDRQIMEIKQFMEYNVFSEY